MYIGGLVLLGLYYRKELVYNSIYTWVIVEQHLNLLRNKYFRNKINIYKFNNSSIIEIFDTNFINKKYILKRNIEKNNLEQNNIDIDFEPTNLFLSVILVQNEIENDVTKEINLFLKKNSEIIFDYEFALIINKFLNLGMNLTIDNFNWKIMDSNINKYSGKNLLFKIDENYHLNCSHILTTDGQV